MIPDQKITKGKGSQLNPLQQTIPESAVLAASFKTFLEGFAFLFQQRKVLQ